MINVLEAVNACIAKPLADVEALFHQELSSDLDCVNQLVKHVSRFRGKMLRPTLVLLSGQAVGSKLGREHVGAVAGHFASNGSQILGRRDDVELSLRRRRVSQQQQRKHREWFFHRTLFTPAL